MKLTEQEKLKVKSFAKKLVEGSFAVNTYNFIPSVNTKLLEKGFDDIVAQSEKVSHDMEEKMDSNSLLIKRSFAITNRLIGIKDDMIKLLKDFEKEGKGGSYLSKVTDKDILDKIATLTKRK